MIRVSWVPGILIVHTHRSILTKPSAPCLYGFRGLPCTSYHRVTCEGPYQRIDCDAQKNSRQRRSALASGRNRDDDWDRPLAIDPSPNVRLGMTATT